jgi:outer membrane lipoprotein-sorting protein
MSRTRSIYASIFLLPAFLLPSIAGPGAYAQAPAAVSAVSSQLPSVDDVIAKNLQAKGGAEKWQAIKSVKMTGRMSAQGTEMPLTVYAMRPNLNRQEITMPAGKAIQAFDGTTAWVVNPMLGIETPQPVPGPAAELAKNSADFDGALLNYKTKGNAIELVGKEKLENKDVYHLKVTTKGGPVQHYLLDADSGIELRMSAEVELGSGQKQTLTTEMSNYKAVNGVMIPHTVTQTAGGRRLLQWTIDTVEFNSVPDDSIFRMPKQ